MKKLKLNLDEIKVESFEVKPTKSKRGTIIANIHFTQTCEYNATCSPLHTCVGISCASCYENTCRLNTCAPAFSCVDTCNYSCNPCTYQPELC